MVGRWIRTEAGMQAATSTELGRLSMFESSFPGQFAWYTLAFFRVWGSTNSPLPLQYPGWIDPLRGLYDT